LLADLSALCRAIAALKVLRRMKERSKRDRDRARRNAATRRWRQRVAQGKEVCPVEYDAEILDLLARTQWLAEREVHSRAEVGAAIERMLKDTAHGSKK
jgi:hypothetical protein